MYFVNEFLRVAVRIYFGQFAKSRPAANGLKKAAALAKFVDRFADANGCFGASVFCCAKISERCF